jgi:peptidoglycan/LPS O-acetylase OafA/YrhL
MKRIPVLDFFRAIAIFFVMLLHAGVAASVTRIGWVGVDLFFVLSGFLVSGLLFNEFKITGKIRPLYFLIRRGFKIYPLFYLVLLFHILYYSFKGISLQPGHIVAEIFFFQNYRPGIMGISWSLAIEEHFYILLCLTIFIAAKKNKIISSMAIPYGCALVCIFCLFLRIYTFQVNGYRSLFVNDFPTHLRMDALAFGVLLSYWFHFGQNSFVTFFSKNKNWLLASSLCLFVPVFIWERETFIINTVEYTFLYIGFGLWISLALAFSANKVAAAKKSWLIDPYNFMVWVGRYSYAIYLCHFIIGPGAANWIRKNYWENLPDSLYLFIYLASDIAAGVILTKLVERPFLTIREKYFPDSDTIRAKLNN